jgi:class 3 adenylate cyclase
VPAGAAPGASCDRCGTPHPPGARFCSQCGAPLTRDTEGALAADAERKQVTVLFSDLTGYTTLSERLDPEETREIMTRIFARAAEVVGRYDGRIEKFIGDAIMAIFGVPQAHEDDPVRAVRAALELHEAVEQLRPDVERRAGAAIALHSGVNTGLVVTGELRFDRGTAGPLGDTINVAARLMALAGTGEIWIGPETRHLVAGMFDLEELGPQEIRGRTGSIPAARVRGASSRPAALGAVRGVFVGRQDEMAVLTTALAEVRAGRPSVIGVRGDPGTGKTRLVQELRGRAGDDVRWLEGRAYAYAENIPYFPLIDLLNRSWGIDEADRPAAVRAKLAAGVGALDGDPAALLPVVGHLYGLPLAPGPPIDREAFPGMLLDVAQRVLAAAARQGLAVVYFQDLHWADASTVALLRELAGSLRTPVLLLCNVRPGYVPPPGMLVLELGELSPRQTEDLLRSLLAGEPPGALARFIAERAEGNPFYVEEVVHALVETQALRRRDGGWTLARELAEAGVPPTIRGVIAARIDRLDERRRRVLRDAAVVGRQFLYAVVAEITREGEQLASSLADLETANLIRTRSRDPELEYAFKHALTQEVAYDGLLRSERQALHARTARAMERLLGDRIPEYVETLAHHYLRAGVADRAVRYLVEAGRKCMARYAIDDADAHYRRAYALLTGHGAAAADDRALVDLLNHWSLVFYYTGNCREWRRLLEAHHAAAERLAEPAVLGLYEGWWGMLLFFCDEYAASLAHLERAVGLARAAGSDRVLAYAESWLGWTLAFVGRPAEALEVAEHAMALGRRLADEPYLTFKPLGAIGFAAAADGDLPRARRAGEELLAIGARTANPRAAMLGHFSLAFAHMIALEPERAVAAAERARAVAPDATYRALSSMYHALALAFARRWAEAGSVVGEVLPVVERLGLGQVVYWLRYVEAVAALGRGEAGRGMAGLETLRRTAPSPWAEVNLHQTLATLYAWIARREIRGDASLLVRHPGFVLRHVLPARRQARTYLERLADDPPHGYRGYRGLALLELARLHAHLGEREAAGRRATEAIALFERQGAEGALAQARALG